MPKIFTPENRNDIRKELLECGLSSRNHFIAAAYDKMNTVIIEQIMQCLVEK